MIASSTIPPSLFWQLVCTVGVKGDRLKKSETKLHFPGDVYATLMNFQLHSET